MNHADQIENRASDLRDAARAFHQAAGQAGSSAAAQALLASLTETLQLLSAGCYQLAADAAPEIVEEYRGLPRKPMYSARVHRAPVSEQELDLVLTLQDVAVAIAGCARNCRGARPTAPPLVEGALSYGRRDGDFSRITSRQRMLDSEAR